MKDPRGVLIELMDKPYHINYITIKKGRARGGHCHKYSEMFLVLEGCVEFIEMKHSFGLAEAPWKVFLQNDIAKTTPKVAHAFYSPDVDSTLLEIRGGGIKFKAEPHKVLRTWVDWINSQPEIKYKKKSTIMGRRK